MANRGVQMDVILIPLRGRKNEFLAPLNCGIWNRSATEEAPLALHLTLVNREQNLYNRKGCVDLARPEFSAIKASLKFELGWIIAKWGQHTFLPTDWHSYPVSLTNRLVRCICWSLMICFFAGWPWYWYAATLTISVTLVLPSWHYMNRVNRKVIFVANPQGSAFDAAFQYANSLGRRRAPE
jgi:hypothetical protein